jgi:Family of unknown function (DUF5357)
MDLSKILSQLLTQVLPYLRTVLKPAQIFSWHTLTLLSIVLAVASFFLIAFQPILIVISAIFLIGGVAWYTTKEPITIQGISLGSWLTGGLISLFLFGIWGNPALIPVAIILWPILSAFVAAVPEFWHEGLKLKTPAPEVRINLVIFLLIHLVLSCWLVFLFTVQGWVQQYPSLRADNLSNSSFVNAINFQSNPTPRGAFILNSVETRLKEQIDGKIWPDVERWLLNANDRIVRISQDVVADQRVEEDALWQIGSNISSRESGYNLDLLANWRGPGSRPEGYHLKKSCQLILSRRRAAAERSPVSLSDLQCGPVSDPIPGLVNLQTPKNTTNNPKT